MNGAKCTQNLLVISYDVEKKNLEKNLVLNHFTSLFVLRPVVTKIIYTSHNRRYFTQALHEVEIQITKCDKSMSETNTWLNSLISNIASSISIL